MEDQKPNVGTAYRPLTYEDIELKNDKGYKLIPDDKETFFKMILKEQVSALSLHLSQGSPSEPADPGPVREAELGGCRRGHLAPTAVHVLRVRRLRAEPPDLLRADPQVLPRPGDASEGVLLAQQRDARLARAVGWRGARLWVAQPGGRAGELTRPDAALRGGEEGKRGTAHTLHPQLCVMFAGSIT